MEAPKTVETEEQGGENVTTTQDGKNVTIITTTKETPTFNWEPVHATSATHLDIGNVMKMDDGLPNHERMSFWHKIPGYWNCDRSAYKPAPPIVYRDEL